MTDESVRIALEFFSGKYNCAQSAMKAILMARNLDFERVFHLAAGFGAGIGHEGNVSGAVTGAIAALGVIEGKYYPDTLMQKEQAYAKGEEFIRIFKQKHGTILCDRLTGIEMNDLKARQKAMDDGTFEKRCPTYVADAVRIAIEIATK